jgi:Cytochrome c7 and related cytochrome c
MNTANLGRSAWLGIMRCLLVLMLMLGGVQVFAQSQAASRNFDHLKTGFPLTGVHGPAKCESCHINGVFKGTPKDCATCHTAGSRLARSNVIFPTNHMPTQQACDSCHNTKSFAGAKFDHVGVTAGSCATCHNGTITKGKTSTHIPTTAACDTCHKSTTSWGSAKPDHAAFNSSTNCASCHNGTQATGKASGHIATTLNCASCHSKDRWTPAKVDHAGFNSSTDCASCHNGRSASGKANTHIPASNTCFSCHAVTGWKPTKFNHTQATVTNQCSTCHSGSFPPADGRPATHIPYQNISGALSANCDTCHKAGFNAWAPAKFHSNVTVAGQCATCHTGAFPPAAGKSSGHPQTNAGCETCHNTSGWAGAKVDHSTFGASTNCTSCHGSSAAGKPSGHMPVSASVNCFSCHTVTGWKPTKFNHTQAAVTNQCSTCHSGAFPPADGRTANHIPYQNVSGAASANCDTCHKGGFAAWSPAKFHGNVTVTGQCATCHTGAFPPAAGKSSGHLQTNAGCETCHTTTGWAGAKVDHSTFTAGTNCASCHGTTATGKPSGHIPVSASVNCFSCHTVTGWKPTKFTHTQVSVANQCSTCHSGAFPPADGRPATHIPYQSVTGASSANCDTCHKSGYAAWSPAKFHTSVTVAAQCHTCHMGNYTPGQRRPNDTTHNGVTNNCESCHKSTSVWTGAQVDHSQYTAATNCATCHNGSGATGKPSNHIPVTLNTCATCHNTSGAWATTKFNHTQVAVTNQCSTCHTGGFLPADGRPTNHIPYQSVTGANSANCDTCHKAGYAAWAPAKFHTSVSVTAQCATCHNGSFPPAAGKSSSHIQTTAACETCHKSTSVWTGASVDHSTFSAATNCTTCHNGSTATGKPAAHIPTTVNCFSCHAVNSWRPTKFSHAQGSQGSITSQCSTCHSGAFPPADGRPTNHIPYQGLSGVAISNCDSCHKGGFSTWAPARFHSNVSISAQCASCHTGNFPPAVGKSSGHIQTTAACETCHKSTTVWTGAKVDHSTFTAATNCASCHNGSTATGKAGNHVPTTASCFSCHSVTAWTPTKFNHTQVTVANQCSTCHSGAFPPADGRPTTHIPYVGIPGVSATNCDSCHKSGFAAWTGARFHGSFTVSTNCHSCHMGNFTPGQRRPNNTTHNAVTTGCESCHRSTASWQTVVFAHTPANAVGTGTCDTCHNGTSARGKTATHIPVSTGPTKCDSCHRSQASWTTAVTMNHTVVATSTCKSCHNGSYVSQGTQGALAKPTNHIPEATQLLNGASMDCKACHTSTASWGTIAMNHNGSQGGGAGWCIGCHRSGTNFLGNMEKESLTHETKTPPAKDCSESGCHRPLGNRGTTYRNWD